MAVSERKVYRGPDEEPFSVLPKSSNFNIELKVIEADESHFKVEMEMHVSFYLAEMFVFGELMNSVSTDFDASTGLVKITVSFKKGEDEEEFNMKFSNLDIDVSMRMFSDSDEDDYAIQFLICSGQEIEEEIVHKANLLVQETANRLSRLLNSGSQR